MTGRRAAGRGTRSADHCARIERKLTIDFSQRWHSGGPWADWSFQPRTTICRRLTAGSRIWQTSHRCLGEFTWCHAISSGWQIHEQRCTCLCSYKIPMCFLITNNGRRLQFFPFSNTRMFVTTDLQQKTIFFVGMTSIDDSLPKHDRPPSSRLSVCQQYKTPSVKWCVDASVVFFSWAMSLVKLCDGSTWDSHMQCVHPKKSNRLREINTEAGKQPEPLFNSQEW